MLGTSGSDVGADVLEVGRDGSEIGSKLEVRRDCSEIGSKHSKDRSGGGTIGGRSESLVSCAWKESLGLIR